MIINYVEDERELSDLISKYLKNEGYTVNNFYTGDDAINHVSDDVDLWILDIMLPGVVNGFDLLKKIKEHNPETLVIFTSARNSDIDKVLGLENGSDDYLAKPFSPKELVIRVNNLLKRANKFSKQVVHYQTYDIDFSSHTVFEEGVEILLTYKEYSLLEYFINNANKEISREEILKAIWKNNDDKKNERVVDDLLRRLREKLPKLKIETIYGFGYRFN